MINSYWVVYSFHQEKGSASKNLTPLKKIFPTAKIEQLIDGWYAVVVDHCDSLTKANELIHKLVSKGYWGGIYNP